MNPQDQRENIDNIPEPPYYPVYSNQREQGAGALLPKSAVLAGFLSMLPGLGQAYIGYYKQAFIHILVFAGSMTVMIQSESEDLLPLLPIFLVFYWAYNIIDAVRKVQIYNRAIAGGKMDPLPDEMISPNLRGSLMGGAILVVAGFAALSNTAFGYSLAWLEEWWPVVPIAFGGYLIYLDRQEKEKKKA